MTVLAIDSAPMLRYRDVIWTPWEEPGLEHLHLEVRADSVVADGLITRLFSGHPFRWHYTITCRPDLAGVAPADPRPATVTTGRPLCRSRWPGI
ncbi:MAG: hypothetical protein ACREYF_11195 [Gammaproteobacteria bacterium]